MRSFATYALLTTSLLAGWLAAEWVISAQQATPPAQEALAPASNSTDATTPEQQASAVETEFDAIATAP